MRFSVTSVDVMCILSICFSVIRDVTCDLCECKCTSASNEDQRNLTVSGAYCDSQDVFTDNGSLEKCQPQPAICNQIWRVDNTQSTLCICDQTTTATLCDCRGKSGGNSLNCTCSNVTNNISMDTPPTTSSTSSKVSLEVSKTSMSYNTTSKTPIESMPRKYSPVGLGLGLFFGLAAITAMVLAIIFVYRRYNEGAANDSLELHDTFWKNGSCHEYRKTPEVPIYYSTLEGDTRQTWSSQADSLDNPTYDTETKIRSTPAPLASQTDLSQDSSTHYTALNLNDRGRTNGGYSDTDYSKSRAGQRSLDTDDEHEYQGLYTEMPSNPSFKEPSLPNTDSEIGVSPSSSLGESLRDSRGNSLPRGTKLPSLADDTDSSEPYYIKLNRDDISSDQSPCLDIPTLGIYNGSTSDNSTSDYEHLNFNREDVLSRQRHNEEDEDAENGGYGIMVMEDRIGDANPPEAWGAEEEYDHLDRGPVGSMGSRPLG